MSTDDLDPAPHGLGPDAPRSPSEEEGEPAAVTGTSKAFAPVQGADDSYELASVSDTESGNSTHSEDSPRHPVQPLFDPSS
ncbi:hypothetical protein NMY22_g4267 [Coprinellus aureogranulatus]|nr:hypothetical protein NMY22_g4267 [Coprinellus aureogranulatus]